MGVYEIFMGKGVMIPVPTFAKMFREEITEHFDPNQGNEQECIDLIIKMKFGEKYTWSTLVHDAFESREGLFKVPMERV